METSIYIFKAVVMFVYGGVLGTIANMLIDFFVKKIENEEQQKKEVVKFNFKYITFGCGCKRTGLKAIPIGGCALNNGVCSKCNKKIEKRYMFVELLLGILFVLVVLVDKSFATSFLFSLVTLALVTLSIIDLKTFEIPVQFNIFILVIGIIMTIIDYRNIVEHIIGFVAVSGFLWFLIIVSRGRAMGGGDCKLMAVCGLILGWKLIIVAFMLGCILGSIIHIARIKISGEERTLAFGPYLAAGIYITYLYGEQILQMYLSLFK